MADGDIGCLAGCGRVAVCRGNCKGCYGKLTRRIAAGQTTWKKLEAAGKAAPAKKRLSGWGHRGY